MVAHDYKYHVLQEQLEKAGILEIFIEAFTKRNNYKQMTGYGREDTVLKPAKGGNFLLSTIPRETQGTAKISGNVPLLKCPEHEAIKLFICPL
jgi:hypothetical protein